MAKGERKKGGTARPSAMPRRKAEDRERRLRQEKTLDEALENTFPASDPVSSLRFTTLPERPL